MAIPELGTKRTCPTCGARYYDLNRAPPACPKCGETIRSKKPVEAVIPAKPAAPTAKPAPAPAKKTPVKKTPAKKTPAKPRPAAAAPGKDDDKKEVEELEPVKGGEEDDGVIEDASDIGEHNDDMAEVKEHVDEPVADIG